MKIELKSSNRLILGMLAVAALGAVFWMMVLSPKREEASELATQVEQLELSLAQHEAEIADAEAARRQFPTDYERLVVLGKAVPGDDETASLLVQVNRIADRAGVRFDDLELTASGSSGESEAAPPAAAGGQPVSATEASAALLPLGASIGPAGLGVMPYTLTFSGSFFEIADFIAGLDEMVGTGAEQVVVDGRLVTIDGFALSAAGAGFPSLEATFAVTTYLTPPGEAAGALPVGEGDTATPTATTTTTGEAP